jgi:hypothetical protein
MPIDKNGEGDTMTHFISTFAMLFVFLNFLPTQAQELSPEIKALLDLNIKKIKMLSTDTVIIAAVKEYNAAPPSSLTNDAWAKLTLVSPQVTAITNNDISAYLKTKQIALITEMFINGADGGKVAFLMKTTYWNHKGKPKHDVPMQGNIWIGPLEIDASTGAYQIQAAIPVLDGTTPIGSIVIGFGLVQMKKTIKH